LGKEAPPLAGLFLFNKSLLKSEKSAKICSFRLINFLFLPISKVAVEMFAPFRLRFCGANLDVAGSIGKLFH
jgi:hypothetical protein